uniref:glycosyltransferase family 39 protein n=1 Tax=Edaphosphingomonas laterariae TaxID=861865 RepID=UPI0015C5E31F|nr:glycosyltransferase family 39 protein [Sphingomonas laterariae]
MQFGVGERASARSGVWIVPACFLLVAGWLVARALAAPLNHDESQYVAAAVLSGQSLIFRDFLSLQPPLHAWLLAPVAWAFAGDSFIALRMTSAAMGLVALAAVYAAQRGLGIGKWPALAATVLMAGCDAFQFTAAVVRNDMAPTMLLALGLLAALTGIRRGEYGWWAAAGLLFGLATSAKLSFAPPLAVAGLFLLAHVRDRRIGVAAVLAFGCGGLAGLVPMAIGYLAGPDAFIYGTLTFGSTAPFDWYRANGLHYRLAPSGKLGDLAYFAILGPTVAALALVGWDGVRRWRGEKLAGFSLEQRLLIALILAGLIGAYLPTPVQRQYLMPLMPPLFIALGAALAAIASRRGRAIALAVLGLFALFGFAKAGWPMLRAATHGAPAVVVDDQAEWIGDALRAQRLTGPVASLSPERLVDSGYPVDPRFATGPFVYRSGALVSPRDAERFRVLTAGTLFAALDRAPPAAILTGYEAGTRKFSIAPDAGLIAYARARSYRAVRLPDGIGVLHIRPQRR